MSSEFYRPMYETDAGYYDDVMDAGLSGELARLRKMRTQIAELAEQIESEGWVDSEGIADAIRLALDL